MEHKVTVDHWLAQGALPPVTVKKGDTLLVTVRENASTGYTWEGKSEGVKYIASTYASIGPDDTVGSSSTRHMEFVCNKSDELILEYRRPWETARANKLLTLKVTVTE